LREWIRRGAGPGLLLPEGPLWARLLVYAMLALISCGLLFYDYSTLGPTLACRIGVATVALAWLFAMPLNLMSHVLIRCLWVGGVIVLSLAAAVWLCLQDWRWSFFGLLAVAGTVWLALHGVVLHFVAHELGCIVIFLGAYFAVRSVSFVSSRASRLKGVEEVPARSEEFKSVVAAFEDGCKAWADKYPFSLRLDRVHRKSTSPGALARTADGKRLFHGTKWENAQGILLDGFRLPSHGGMFGKGIYFADCPLKSWQYTDYSALGPGVMLFCWVEMGKAKHAKRAMTHLSGPPHRNLFQWLRGAEKFDSVVGDDHSAGGSLRVPEYIVYDPSRVEVDYVLEIRQA